MKRFYYIIGVFVLATGILFILPLPWNLRFWILGAMMLIYLSILAWGAYRIDSQMFVRSICAGSRTGSRVAITFDDGPHPSNSASILEIFEKHDCKATFFLCGSKLEGKEEEVKAMLSGGHSVGNHSFSHSSFFPLFRSKKIRGEIIETNRILQEITGIAVRFFRPPFGVTNPRISSGLHGLHMQVVGWSIRSFDTRNEAAEKVVDRIMKKVRAGDIILLHETSDHIIQILEMLIPRLKLRDLNCVNMDQMLD